MDTGWKKFLGDVLHGAGDDPALRPAPAVRALFGLAPASTLENVDCGWRRIGSGGGARRQTTYGRPSRRSAGGGPA